jgi:ribosomal-protein-alanine N-acetyltransferase
MNSLKTKIDAIKSDDTWSLKTTQTELKVFRREFLTQEFVDQLKDVEINRYLEMRYAPPDYGQQSTYIDYNLDSQSSLYLAVFERGTNTVIGTLRLSEIDAFHSRAQIGILIAFRQFWGKGIAQEIISSATKFAHENLGVRRMSAGCYTDNIGSKRAFEKAGYSLEGELKNYWTLGTPDQAGESTGEFLLASFI